MKDSKEMNSIFNLLKINLKLMKTYKNEVLRSFENLSKKEFNSIDENLTQIGKILHGNFSKVESLLRENVSNEIEFYKKFFFKDQTGIKNIDDKYNVDTISMTKKDFEDLRKKDPLYRNIFFWSELLIKKIEMLIQFFDIEVIKDNYDLDDDEIYSLIRDISNIYHRIILLRKARKHQYFFTGDILRRINIK